MSVADQLVSVVKPFFDFCESYGWIAEKSYILKVPAIDAAIAPVADGMGLGLSLLKYMITLFAAYPLMIVFRFLPSKTLKHMMSAGVGIFFVQWIFGPDWIHSFIAISMTYIICLLGPKKSVGKLTYFAVLGHMVGCHAYRMYVNYLSGSPYHLFELDFTGVQMVLTMKLTSFGYNVQDGARKVKADEDKSPADNKMVDKNSLAKKKIRESQDKYAIRQLPNPLEFFSYAFCFAQLMVGPAFEYSDFIGVIETGSSNCPPNHKMEDNEKPKFFRGKSLFDANSVVSALHKLVLGVVCMVGYMQLSGRGFTTHYAYQLDWIAARPWWVRYAHMFTCMMSERFKFYFIWKMSEGANILGGFGFQGYEGDLKTPRGFRGVENMDILGFEFSCSVQTLSRAWNKGTQAWLERYTYNRMGGDIFILYFVSAIWHGLYPGFFLFFLSVPLLTAIERICKKKLNKLVVPTYNFKDIDTYPSGLVPALYWFFCWLCKALAMNYVTMTFSMGYYVNSMTALGSYNHVPHILFVVVLILLNILL